MRATWVLAIALALAGCAGVQANSPEMESAAQAVPTDYRPQIVTALKSYLKDPYSIRSAEISDPAPGFIGILRGGNGMVVCTRFNAKNSFGAYIGQRPMAFIFRNGRIADMIPEQPMACAGRLYQPFPELEHIT